MDLASLSDRLERISAGYAVREGFTRDDDWFLLKLVVGPRAHGRAGVPRLRGATSWGAPGESSVS